MRNKEDYNITDERIGIIKNYIENECFLTYAEICEDFGWIPDSKGNTKKAQFKVIDAIAEYEKIGKNKGLKYKFTKIKDLIKKETYNTSIYADNIDMVLTYIIYENMVNGVYTISELRALEIAGLVNGNFKVCRNKPYVASKVLDVDMDIMNYVINKEHTKLLGIFETSLNRLRRDGILMYNKGFLIIENIEDGSYVDEEGRPIWKERKRWATPEETAKIIDIRSKVLIKMKMTMRTAFLTGNLSEVNKRTIEELSKDMNIKYFYKGYQIMASGVGMKHKIDKYEALENKSELNAKVLSEHTQTYINESKNALKEKTIKSFKLRGNFLNDAKTVMNEIISLKNEDYDLTNKIDNYYKNNKEFAV